MADNAAGFAPSFVPFDVHWQPIESAPHNIVLRLGWWEYCDRDGRPVWEQTFSCATAGSWWSFRRHPRATHWAYPPMPPMMNGEITAASRSRPKIRWSGV